MICRQFVAVGDNLLILLPTINPGGTKRDQKQICLWQQRHRPFISLVDHLQGLLPAGRRECSVMHRAVIHSVVKEKLFTGEWLTGDYSFDRMRDR
jgi:hypothetical protein